MDDGPRVLLVDRGSGLPVALLVVLAAAGTTGAIFTLTFVPLSLVGRSPWPLGLGSVVVSIAIGVVLWLTSRYRRANAGPPADRWRTIAIFDFGSDHLERPDGTPLAVLGNVTIRSRLRLLPGVSRRLMAEWPGGRMLIVREGSFSLGFPEMAEALRARGLRFEKMGLLD